MIGHIVRAILKEYCTANIKKILPVSQSAWNTRFYFGHQKLCMDNNRFYWCFIHHQHLRPYRSDASIKILMQKSLKEVVPSAFPTTCMACDSCCIVYIYIFEKQIMILFDAKIYVYFV